MEFRVRGYQVYYAFEAILLTCYQWCERRQTVKKLMMIYISSDKRCVDSHLNRLDEAISVRTYKHFFFFFFFFFSVSIKLPWRYLTNHVNWRLSYLGSE